MNKTILVHYVCVGGKTRSSAYQLLSQYHEMINNNSHKGDGTTHYILPTNDENRIECINPKLVSGDEMSKITATMNTYKAKVDEFLESAKRLKDDEISETSTEAFNKPENKMTLGTRISALCEKIKRIFVKR